MTSSEKRGFAIVATIVLAVVLLFTAANYLNNSSKADQTCYDDFAAIYTWDQARPTLDKIWADKFISNGECQEMNEAYDNAKANRDVENIQGVVNDYKRL